MNKSITVAIITKNNPTKLTRCLSSIKNQKMKPLSVLVIDNDKNKTALPVVIFFQKSIPITYINESSDGVPRARNTAVTECKTQILCFTDDDCVLHPFWTTEVALTLNLSNTAFILGKSLLSNGRNIIAQTLQTRQGHWLSYELKKNHGSPSPFLMDTKNVAYDMRTFKKNRLSFDESFQISGFDSADTDLGFQIQSKGLRGIYNPRMIAYHEETPTFRLMIKKAYFRGMLALLLSKKWNLKGEFIHVKDRDLIYYLRRMKYWPGEYRRMLKHHNGNMWEKLFIFGLIKLHDYAYLRGFIHQTDLLGINVNDYST